MLYIDPGGQYLHILLIDLFLLAARWLLLIQTLYTQCCLKDCLFNHWLCQETLCKFSYLAQTAQLAAPSCRRAEVGLFSFFACIVKHDKKERLSGCETAVLATLLGTVLLAHVEPFPGGELCSQSIWTVPTKSSLSFFSWWFKRIANFGVAEYALLNQLTSGRSWSCPFEKAGWLCGKLAWSLNHLSFLLGEGIKLVMSSAAKCAIRPVNGHFRTSNCLPQGTVSTC